MRLRPEDIRAARSCDFLTSWKFSSNGEENFQAAMAELSRRGIKIVEKGAFAFLPKSSIALNGRLRVKRGFQSRESRVQAPPLWHELVHYNQRADVGRHRFNTRYFLVPRQRWAWEVAAYRQGMSVRIVQGERRATTDKYIESVISSFGRLYLLLRMSKADKALTRDIFKEWEEVVRGW